MTKPALSPQVLAVIQQFRTCEFATFTKDGQLAVVPVIPLWDAERQTILVNTAAGIPQKAYNVQRNPKVALLFSDPLGSAMPAPPLVLIQGTVVLSEDLDYERLGRFEDDIQRKVPAQDYRANPIMGRIMVWYYVRLLMDVTPYRVIQWPSGQATASGDITGPALPPYPTTTPAQERSPIWQASWEQLGKTYPSAVLTVSGPDSFPFSYRGTVVFDQTAKRVIITPAHPLTPLALPPQTEANVLFHSYAESMQQSSMRQFQLRGQITVTHDQVLLTPTHFSPGMGSRRADHPIGLEQVTVPFRFIRSGQRKTNVYRKKRSFRQRDLTE